MTLNVLVKGIKKVERKMLVLFTTETVGKYCESFLQSYLLTKWHTIPFFSSESLLWCREMMVER